MYHRLNLCTKRTACVLGLLGLTLLLGACAEEAATAGTRAATECARNDLVAQCPANTVPQLDVDAQAQCSASGSIDVSEGVDNLMGSGAVSSACVGSGSCRLVCKLAVPCDHGVERISPTEGIVCAPPPEGCGNGVCDRGESPESCAIDCGADCTAEDTRCNEGRLQTCTPRGVWDEGIDCPEGQRCASTDGTAVCRADACGDGNLDEGEICDDGNGENGDGCDSNCTVSRCGNGIRAGSEECDDGNRDNQDNCTNECFFSRCGDGFVHEGEECDDGNPTDGDACTTQCRNARCGDGVVQVGTEDCDDGNNDDFDGCTNGCALPACGDGIVQNMEQCDDGNDVDTDACTNRCTNAACGDGSVQADVEECDDGNDDDTDGCTSACEVSFCGNGRVDNGEMCDDGNQLNTDACLNTCVPATCGDAFVQTGVEQCDDANAVNTDDCTNECQDARCGDGIVHGGVEDCDDNNRVDTDECTNECEVARCGDGIVETGVDQCDDGNDDDGDACTNDCRNARCGDGVVRDGLEQCDDGNNVNTDACANNCQEARCGDRIIRTDLEPGEAGYEYCDDGNDNHFDGCNDECLLTETENNDFCARGDQFSADLITGVMEGYDGGISASQDTFLFQLNCGVGAGGDCPDNANRTWTFTLEYDRNSNLCEGRVNRVENIFGSMGECCDSDAIRGCSNPGSQQKFQIVVTRNGVCDELLRDEINFCRFVDDDGACCNNVNGLTGSCCIPSPRDLLCIPANDFRGNTRYLRWSYTGRVGGEYGFGLQSFSEGAFEYSLMVEVE